VDGSLPALDLRLQRRCDALDLAGNLLHVQRARHGPLPFTLGRDSDYPATLGVAYPPRLSRGLVLVKWWLLALPNYLVVGTFFGSGSSGGLVLVLIAGVALLLTGRYPRGIFDFVLGMNRWSLRVLAYAALMTDEYPPFRLDLGGDDPAALSVGADGPEPATGGAR
jgi:hypothetical protein